MKKYLLLFLMTFILTSHLTTLAQINDIKVYINAEEINNENCFIKNGRIIIPARYISQSLGCEVIWNESDRSVEIKDGEENLKFIIDSNEYYFNNEKKRSDIAPVIKNNLTILPLRLISENLGHKVIWEEEKREVIIIKKNAYEDDNFKTLIELEIIDEEDLSKSEYIKNIEAFETLYRTGTEYHGTASDLENWYNSENFNCFEPLDHIKDEMKYFLYNLNTSFRSRIFSDGDFKNFSFDDNLTNKNALKYLIRIIGNTSGCTGEANEFFYTKTEEIYDTAYKKGLIENTDISLSDKPITRHDFYNLINKAIYVEYVKGGYVNTTTTQIKEIQNYLNSDKKEKRKDRYKKPEITQTDSEKIEADIKINDDMEITWTIPAKHSFFITGDYNFDVTYHFNDNSTFSPKGSNSLFYNYKINLKKSIIRFLHEFPKKEIDYIRCTYSKQTDNILKIGYFDIDISGFVTLKEIGQEIKPGKIYHPHPYSDFFSGFTLPEGHNLKEGVSYIIYSKGNIYRKDDYNQTFFKIFTPDEATNKFSFNGTHLFMSEIKIRQFSISKNGENSFLIEMTPESKESFIPEVK